MDKEKVMMAMDHIDAELIAEAAGRGKSVKKSSWKKVAVIAACMCLALVGTVAAAGSGIPVEFYGNDYEWLKKLDESLVGGYWTSGAAVIREDELSEEVRTLAAENPDLRFYGFQSWEEMEQLIGIDLVNNPLLDEAEKRELTMSYLEPVVKGHGILDIQQDDLGIRALALDAYYGYFPAGAKMSYSVTLSALVKPEVGTEGDDKFFGTCYTEEQKNRMTIEEYEMANGQTATIVAIPKWTTDDKYMGNFYDAYFNGNKSIISVQVKSSSVLLGIEGEEQYDQQALTAMKEVLDAFE